MRKVLMNPLILKQYHPMIEVQKQKKSHSKANQTKKQEILVKYK